MTSLATPSHRSAPTTPRSMGVTGTTNLHVDHSPSNDRHTNVVLTGVTMRRSTTTTRSHSTTIHRPTATTATSPGTGTTTTESTQSTADKTSLKLNCIGYNCKGFKQSIDCVSLLLSDCDIIGLCETWLRPGELPVIKSSLGIMPEHRSDDLLVFSKSGCGRRSPAVACWASDHWVVGSNPLRGKFRH